MYEYNRITHSQTVIMIFILSIQIECLESIIKIFIEIKFLSAILCRRTFQSYPHLYFEFELFEKFLLERMQNSSWYHKAVQRRA